MIELRDEHRRCWAQSRYVHLRGALSADERRALARWTEELVAWPESPGRWMKYYEAEEGGRRQLCRIENFLPYHAGARDFLERADLAACLEELLGEPVRVFKEKINLKLPGGGAFAPHQDAPAFASFAPRYHVTLMLGVDATTSANGCLELVEGHAEERTLAQSEDGTLAPAAVAACAWRALPTEPGDLLLFDSYVPHRSGPNRSAEPRRAWFVTYNRRSDGDHREAYFAEKRRVFPPECERDPDAPLPAEAARFNLGNPIR